MKIKDLKEEHPAIYELAMKRCDEGVDENYPIMGAFTWGETPEGSGFWSDIYDGKFQVFYDRYPEYAKDPVKFSIEEKDWSKASDEELMAEALNYIGKTIRCLRSNTAHLIKSVEAAKLTRKIWAHTEDFDLVLIYDNGKWAETVSQTEQTDHEGRPIKYWGGLDEKHNSEPKAGDMVEASDIVSFADYWNGYFTGGKTKKGFYIIEPDNGKLQEFKFIRLPQKSEVESAAIEAMEEIDYHNFPKDLFLAGVKWGQHNPDKK